MLFKNKNFFLFLIISCFLFLVQSLYQISIDENQFFNLVYFEENIFQSLKNDDVQLPLYYALVSALTNIETSASILRLINIFLWVVGSLMILETLKNKKSGIALCFVFFSPLALKYSWEIRPYALLYFLSCLYYFLQERNFHPLSRLITIILLSLTHYAGFLFLIVQNLPLNKSQFRKQKVALLLGVVLLVSVYSGRDFINDMLVSHGYRPSLSFKVISFQLLTLFGGPGIFLVFFSAIFESIRHQDLKGLSPLAGLGLFLFILLAKNILFSPSFEARYFIPFIPFVVASLERLDIHPRWNKGPVLLLIFFSTIFWSLYTNTTHQRELIKNLPVKKLVELKTPNKILYVLDHPCPKRELHLRKISYRCISNLSRVAVLNEESFVLIFKNPDLKNQYQKLLGKIHFENQDYILITTKKSSL